MDSAEDRMNTGRATLPDVLEFRGQERRWPRKFHPIL
jgi:hypothetical protein